MWVLYANVVCYLHYKCTPKTFVTVKLEGRYYLTQACTSCTCPAARPVVHPPRSVQLHVFGTTINSNSLHLNQCPQKSPTYYVHLYSTFVSIFLTSCTPECTRNYRSAWCLALLNAPKSSKPTTYVHALSLRSKVDVKKS